jgi:predicted protein tyrosine phosphatase
VTYIDVAVEDDNVAATSIFNFDTIYDFAKSHDVGKYLSISCYVLLLAQM